MEWKPPADLVCHPAKAQLEAMLRSNKIGRKLAEGFEHMEQKRMKSEDALAAARQTVEKATSEATEQLTQARAVEAQVMDLLNEAEKKVVATKAHCDECLVVAGAASSNSAPPPPDPKFLPGQSVCHWWASWFQGCTAEKAPKQYKKGKGRPAWYSAEVVSLGGIQTLWHAGTLYTGHVYKVH